MAESAVNFLLENLRGVLVSNAGGSDHDELEKLRDEISLLKAFLKDASKNKSKSTSTSKAFREMERKIRELIYEVDDIMDSYLSQIAIAKKGSFFQRTFNSKQRVSLAQVVNSLRENKVMPVFEAAKMYFVNMPNDDGSGTSAAEPSMKVTKVPIIREEQIIGLEDDEETIINYLLEETDELEVISIVGMPGLGKTTLARKIYQNPRIRSEFQNLIWINVSQEFNRKDILLAILKKFTNHQDMYSMSDVELVITLRGYLETGKFLIVMDDLWAVEHWNDIEHAFPRNNKMGKVLITTRNKHVAAQANIHRQPYVLRFMTPNESWELLQVLVFGEPNSCPPELESIGKHIANKCDGLSLAVVVIAGILRDQYGSIMSESTIKTWSKVCENVSEYLRNNKGYQLSEVIALSHDKLPDDLRDCFIYLGVFPEDYEISASTLTRLWIAEGFIKQKDGHSLEETAYDILYELINRNLVMADKLNPSGKVKTCRVHETIHEFCNSKAAFRELNLFQEIKRTTDGGFSPPVSDLKKCRRLCIHSHLLPFLSQIPKDLHVRSLLCFCKDTVILTPKLNSTIPDAFNLLRVLESKSFKFDTFPTKVANLFHLRYLTLCCDDLSVLPASICDLWNLQTLVVDTRSRTLIFKGSIWKMVQLRHVNTKASIILSRTGERKSEDNAGDNLQTLCMLSPECCTDDVFNKARHLKDLGIRGQLATLFDASSLDTLDRLENLKLLHDIFPESVSRNPLHGLPKPNWFPPNLKKLTISGTYLDWEHMSTLGKINTLKVLKLKDNAFRGDTWNAVSEGGFPVLQFFLISRSDLASWTASEDYFPALRCLVLKRCEQLREIPLSLAKSLEVLDIERVSKSAASSAREIENIKREMEGQQKGRGGRFKLSIGPVFE